MNVISLKSKVLLTSISYAVALFVFVLCHSIFLKFDGQNVPFIPWGYTTESAWLPLVKAGIVLCLFALIGFGFYIQDYLLDREQRLARNYIELISL